jgi:macrolide-specific efflux system membrane fusion protein
MKRIWIGIIVVIIVVVGFFFIRKRLTSKSKQPQITVTEVTRGNIEVKVLSTGTIQPYTRVEVNSPVNGRIDRIVVDEGAVVKPNDILAWISSEDRIALLDAARSKLEDAQKKGDSAAINEAKASQVIADNAYKKVPLTNSISGQVISRSCEPGQNVTTQTVLFVISDRLVASVQVDEADIGKITLGQDAIIVLDAFPSESVPAKVTKISHEGEVVSDVVIYTVMVEPLNVPARWASGMTANVSFLVINKQNVLTLPNSVLKERDGEKFVMVSTGSRPEPRKVETGATDGKTIEITEGLSEGDKILVGSNTQSSNGTNNDAERGMRRTMRGMPPPGGF